MKQKLHCLGFLLLVLSMLMPFSGAVQAQAPQPEAGSCKPLEVAERQELERLSEAKPKGLTETEYARFLELSARQEACVATPADGIGITVVSGYGFNQSSGTYTPITGGTVHGTGTVDDVNYNGVNIGFTFKYDGTDYTQLGINTNGFVRFGGTIFSYSCSYTPISSSDTTNCKNLISALGMDLQGNTGGELRSELLGSAPNRVFVVQWKDFRYYGAAGDSFNFQIRLYETSNNIEIVYGSFTKNSTSRIPQVGIKGATNTDYSNRTGSDWAASTAGSVNSATMTLNNSGASPASGQTYQWTPPFGPPGCANIGAPADAATGVSIYQDLSWSPGTGGMPTNYDVYFGTSPTPPFVVNQANSPYDPGTMVYSTTYYWQIIPKNGDGSATGCPVWSFTTEADPTVTSFPYSQNFDSGSAPGWTYENTNGDAYFWSLSTSYRRGTSGYGAYVSWNSSLAMDDWLFTPPLQLTGGTTYAVRFFYKAYSSTYPESLAVDWGSAPASGNMSGTPIFDHVNFTHTTMKEAIATFTPPSNGIYYVGFHGHSNANKYHLILDDVTIYDSSDSTWNWTGATDTDWYVGSNWEGNIVPGELDTVNIPAAPANQPAMTNTHSEVSYGRVNNLTIQNGASLSLATNHNLKVEGTLTNNGSFQQTRYLGGGGSANFLRILNVAGSLTKYYGVDITNTNGIAMGNTTVVVKGNQTSGCTTNPSDALLHRCYQITPTSNQQATIKFWFTEAERNGQDSTTLKLWHYDGPPGQWSLVGDTYTFSEMGPTCTSGGGMECWFQAQNVTTYSPFGLGSDVAPSAITLQTFGAAQTNMVFLGLLLAFGIVIGGVLLVYRKRG